MRMIQIACLLMLLGAQFRMPPPPAGSSCVCQDAAKHNVWCRPCAVGYVAGIEIRSAMLFEALDAHGHEIDPASISCTTCRAALASDGFCEPCRRGFVKEKLYFSRLTYLVARGERRDVSKLSCEICRSSSTCRRVDGKGQRWCDECRVGLIGNVAFTDRRQFDAAGKETRRLHEAIETSRRCEYCAIAQFMDAACPRCRITYRDGQRVEPRPPGDNR